MGETAPRPRAPHASQRRRAPLIVCVRACVRACLLCLVAPQGDRRRVGRLEELKLCWAVRGCIEFPYLGGHYFRYVSFRLRLVFLVVFLDIVSLSCMPHSVIRILSVRELIHPSSQAADRNLSYAYTLLIPSSHACAPFACSRHFDGHAKPKPNKNTIIDTNWTRK